MSDLWSSVTPVGCLCHLPIQVWNHSDEIEGLLALCLYSTDMFLEGEVWIQSQPKQFGRFFNWQECITDPDDKGVSELWIEVQWNAQLRIYGQRIWHHSLSPIHARYLLPAANVFLWYWGSAHETDDQIINKDCSEKVMGGGVGQDTRWSAC